MSPNKSKARTWMREPIYFPSAVLYQMPRAIAVSREHLRSNLHAILERPPVPPVRINPEVPPSSKRLSTSVWRKTESYVSGRVRVAADLKRLKTRHGFGLSAATASATAVHEPSLQRRQWAVPVAGTISLGSRFSSIWLRAAASPKVLRTFQITSDGRAKGGLS